MFQCLTASFEAYVVLSCRPTTSQPQADRPASSSAVAGEPRSPRKQTSRNGCASYITQHMQKTQIVLISFDKDVSSVYCMLEHINTAELQAWVFLDRIWKMTSVCLLTCRLGYANIKPRTNCHLELNYIPVTKASRRSDASAPLPAAAKPAWGSKTASDLARSSRSERAASAKAVSDSCEQSHAACDTAVQSLRWDYLHPKIHTKTDSFVAGQLVVRWSRTFKNIHLRAAVRHWQLDQLGAAYHHNEATSDVVTSYSLAAHRAR